VITRLNVGGPALQATLLTARLDPTRFETLLVAGREGPREGNMVELGSTDPVPVMVVPALGREISPLDDLLALWRLIVIARRFRPDVVHTHLAKAGFLGRIAGRLAGAPVIVHTYHGTVFSGYFSAWRSAVFVGLERWLGRISSRLIAITPAQRRELIDLRLAPPDRIVEIALGFDLDRFATPIDRREARAACGITAAGPLIGIVARLVPIKDIPTFVHAVRILATRVPGLQAIVVGDGDDRPALEALVSELGLTDRVRFLGIRGDMPTVYAALDVVVLTSRNEGSPVSIIEAMSSRRAVVATKVGGVPDVVSDGESGLLAEPGDPEDVARKVERLLGDAALRSRLGERGQVIARARYGSARLVSDVTSLYLSALEQARH
jgi:glycosyltransferase involved in cell wall biosynthesis